jgi:hypothetical protein
MTIASRTLLLALLAACLVAGSASLATAKGVDTTKAYRGTGWGDNVTISFNKDAQKIRYRSDGMPNHELLPEYAVPNPGVVVPDETNSHVETAEEAIKPQVYDFPLTSAPRRADEATKIKTGPVGLMISGAMSYNPFEGDGKTVAAASNFTLTNSQGEEVPFVDDCFGHPAPRPLSAYHYHALSTCVTRQVDEKKGPSHIQGIALDGFPIYGDRDITGKKVDLKDLDRCNGIKSPTPEFPDGIYHYVMTDEPTKQSSIRCLTGRVPKSVEDVLEDPSYRCPLLEYSRRAKVD